MKKIFFAGLIALLFLTGCGKTEIINCTQTQKTMGVDMNSVLNIELKGNNLKKINMTIDTILPESYLSKKQVFVDSFTKQYKDFDKTYGVKPEIKETENDKEIGNIFELEESILSKFYTTQGKLQIRCDPYQITNDIFHRSRTIKILNL